MFQFLIDENLPPLYQDELRKRLPDITILKIGDSSPETLRIGLTVGRVGCWFVKGLLFQ
ncbi:hypothetical protein PN462_23165 [Spirulina sp. CS-785/01]|uniref:hypothetical protein n=1 Tax=Spirulina sp. CS-785/01 TaxID=3021716 RepID=UPI00232CD0F6|nr:hypothetical protein [Spirulina sp. CS-785/01]MDB9316030.1 hypothetical protein [Spirulina sp. CS-785/01]